MSPENREAMARADLARSSEALRASDALLGLDLARDAVSRAYYAAFHAACAVLARLDVQARTHRGVQRLVNAHLVQAGHLSAQHNQAFNRLQERRNVADYGVDEVSIDEARELVGLAHDFVGECTRLVDTITSSG